MGTGNKLFAFFLLTLLVFPGKLWADESSASACLVRYENAKFIVDNNFLIDLAAQPEEILQDRRYRLSEWLNIRYYALSDYPIRFTQVNGKLYSVQFLFGQGSANELTLVLYDLKIDKHTSLDDLEAYFGSRGIDYTRGKNNIATYFAGFFYNNGELSVCECKAVVLRRYGDYYFKHTADKPWWVD